MTISAYDLYTNVLTAESFLINIQTTALSNGWIEDEDSINTLGELYIHSLGEFGNQSLYHSFKIHTADDDSTKKYLLWHCNTGYDSVSEWDAQPGKISVIPDLAFDYIGIRHHWDLVQGYHSNSLSAYWIDLTVERQYVFSNSQFIMCTHKVIHTDNTANTFVGWCTMFVGAADSIDPTVETSLNLTMTSSWGIDGYNGSILSPQMKLPNNVSSSFWYRYNYGYTRTPFGFKYDSKHQVDLPSLNSTVNYGYLDDQTKYFYSSVPLLSCYSSIYSNSDSPTTKDYHYNNTYLYGSATKYWDNYTPNWAGSILKNTSSSTLTMVKPIIFNYEISGVDTYFYPTRASLPYYATRMKPFHSVEDIVTIGARDFMIFPLFDINDYYGIAIEV